LFSFDAVSVLSFKLLAFFISHLSKNKPMGREIAQVVSRRPLTAKTRVGFVADKVALGQVFLLVLRFSPVIIFPPSLSKLISSGECVI
jgi:hypothetical protein